MNKTACIFDIYRGTTHDGPGLRDTVFFKGCPLSCQWCHNPEGIPISRDIWWNEHSCIGCHTCLNSCDKGAIQADAEGIHIDRSKCDTCLECVHQCPAKALSVIGEQVELEKLITEVMKDEAYYHQTGGGVTASGGEVLLQAEFIAEFFCQLRKNGINTALDTSGAVSEKALRTVLPYTDIVLYDLKLMDASLHKQYCGSNNVQIINNARVIADGIRDGVFDCDMWIRTPLIPGATATESNVAAISEFINEHLLPAVSRWELCAFNNSCISKYKRLEKEWAYSGVQLLNRSNANELLAAAKSGDFKEVYLTGIIHEED